ESENEEESNYFISHFHTENCRDKNPRQFFYTSTSPAPHQAPATPKLRQATRHPLSQMKSRHLPKYKFQYYSPHKIHPAAQNRSIAQTLMNRRPQAILHR